MWGWSGRLEQLESSGAEQIRQHWCHFESGDVDFGYPHKPPGFALCDKRNQDALDKLRSLAIVVDNHVRCLDMVPREKDPKRH